MKNMMSAGMAMMGIIAMEMMLSHVFNDKVGKAFSRGAVIALPFYYGFKMIEKRREWKKADGSL
ncbi:MAG: hypothetical protein NC429_14665 [Lachnospiraceae bacterium]|nr:hypothetical protein [Lachnospiraceae bacterium]